MFGYYWLLVTSYVSSPLAIPIPDAFNPLNWLGEAFRTARDQIVALVEASLSNPPRASESAPIGALYRMMLTPTEWWAWLVLVYAIVIAIVMFRSIGRVGYAIVVFAATITLGPIYITLLREMRDVGDNVAEAFSKISSWSTPETLETSGSLLLDILSFGSVILSGYNVVAFGLSTEPAFVLATALLPLAFAVSALGSRTRNITNFFASVTLVLGLIGRPTAVLIIELFQILGSTQPGPNLTIVQNLVTTVAFVLAVLVQLILMAVVYTGIKHVQGAIASQISQVRSKVGTTVRNTVKVRKDGGSKPTSQRPMPVVVTNNPINKPIKSAVSARTSSAIVTLGIKGVVAGATAVATKNPKLAVAATKVVDIKKKLKM